MVLCFVLPTLKMEYGIYKLCGNAPSWEFGFVQNKMEKKGYLTFKNGRSSGFERQFFDASKLTYNSSSRYNYIFFGTLNIQNWKWFFEVESR